MRDLDKDSDAERGLAVAQRRWEDLDKDGSNPSRGLLVSDVINLFFDLERSGKDLGDLREGASGAEIFARLVSLMKNHGQSDAHQFVSEQTFRLGQTLAQRRIQNGASGGVAQNYPGDQNDRSWSGFIGRVNRGENKRG